MRKVLYAVCLSSLLSFSCQTVEQTKMVTQIESSLKNPNKEEFSYGKVTPEVPKEISIMQEKFWYKGRNLPLYALLKDFALSKGKDVSLDESSSSLFLSGEFKGTLGEFLKKIKREYGCEYSFDGTVIFVGNCDLRKTNKTWELFLKEEGVFPKVSLDYEGSFEGLIKTISYLSGWQIILKDYDSSKDKQVFFTRKNLTLNDLISEIANMFDLSVDYDVRNKVVYLSGLETRVFKIPLLPKEISYSSTISSKGFSGSQSQRSVNVKEKFWDIEKKIKAILSSKGRVFVSPYSGVIYVTDKPSVIQKVEKLIKQTIKEALSQVSFRVVIYELTYNTQHQTGISWATVFNNARVNFLGGEKNEYILEVKGNGSVFSHPFEYLFKLLSRYGKVKVVYDNYVKTMSNEPVVIYPTDKFRYVSELKVEHIGDNNVEITPKFDTLTLGLQVSLLPKRLDENSVKFDINVGDTNIKSFSTYEFNGYSFTTPELVGDNRVAFSTILKSGQLEVLTGWKTYKIVNDDAGLPLISEVPLMGRLAKSSNHKIVSSEFIIAIYLY